MRASICLVALVLGVAALTTLPQEKKSTLKLPKTQQQTFAISNQVTTEATMADEIILINLLDELPLTPEQREDISARLGVGSVVGLSDEARTRAKSNTAAGAAQLARAEELIGVAEAARTRTALDQAQVELNLVRFAETANAQARIDALSVSLEEEERLATEQAVTEAAQAAQQTQPPVTESSSSSPALGSVRLSNGNTAGPVGIEAARIMEQRTGVPATTWELIIARESNGDPNASNPSGARGLFQTMPFHGSTATVADQIEAAVRAYNAQGLSAWGM